MTGELPAHGATYTLALTSSEGTFSILGGGTGARKAVVLFVKADPGNTATILWGINSATYPLIPGEPVAIDIPPGYWIDVQGLRFSGNGNTGQLVQVVGVFLP